MKPAIDFLLSDEGDLIRVNNDLVRGYSDEQHIQDIFQLEPGELKESPLVGLGIAKQINGLIDGNLRRQALMQLTADGYDVRKLEFNGENIDIDAEREG